MLDPERLSGAELGAQYTRGALRLSATAFANRLSDAIANVSVAEGPGIFPAVGFVAAGGTYRQRQNLSAIRVRGIEFSADIKRDSLNASFGASYAQAEVQSKGPAAALDGLQPAQTPRLNLSGAISWEKRGRALSLVVRHVGRQFEDDLNHEVLASANTVDLFGAWPVTNKVQLTARAENLFDERVEAAVGSDGSIERATPRALWLGVRLRAR